MASMTSENSMMAFSPPAATGVAGNGVAPENNDDRLFLRSFSATPIIEFGEVSG